VTRDLHQAGEPTIVGPTNATHVRWQIVPVGHYGLLTITVVFRPFAFSPRNCEVTNRRCAIVLDVHAVCDLEANGSLVPGA
jgi:hypothetical protein